jgi:hypothetical protein
MEKVCPACNKLTIENYKCNKCGKSMVDTGRAQEIFQDDYTANMPINDASEYCIHIFNCEYCNNRESIAVNKISV